MSFSPNPNVGENPAGEGREQSRERVRAQRRYGVNKAWPQLICGGEGTLDRGLALQCLPPSGQEPAFCTPVSARRWLGQAWEI